MDTTKNAFNDMLCDAQCVPQNVEPLATCARCGVVRYDDKKQPWVSTYCLRDPDAENKLDDIVRLWYCPTEQCGWVNRCSIWTHAGLTAAMQRMQRRKRA